MTSAASESCASHELKGAPDENSVEAFPLLKDPITIVAIQKWPSVRIDCSANLFLVGGAEISTLGFAQCAFRQSLQCSSVDLHRIGRL